MHLQGEVLAYGRWRLALDEVDLLAPGVEPRTREPEVRSVVSWYEPELVDVEVRCRVDVADVDRDVMHGEWSHPFIMPGSGLVVAAHSYRIICRYWGDPSIMLRRSGPKSFPPLHRQAHNPPL
jgi:hypothetical protein